MTLLGPQAYSGPLSGPGGPSGPLLHLGHQLSLGLIVWFWCLEVYALFSTSFSGFGTRFWSGALWDKGRAQFQFAFFSSNNGWNGILSRALALGDVYMLFWYVCCRHCYSHWHLRKKCVKCPYKHENLVRFCVVLLTRRYVKCDIIATVLWQMNKKVGIFPRLFCRLEFNGRKIYWSRSRCH